MRMSSCLSASSTVSRAANAAVCSRAANAAVWLMLGLGVACKKTEAPDPGKTATTATTLLATAASAPSAADAPSPKAPSASAPTASVAAFTGKLTPALVGAYQAPTLFGLSADEAIARVTASLGPPTSRDERNVSWAAADDATCRAFSIQLNGKSVGSYSNAPDVKAASFGEQWGIMCLLRAGVEPKRRAFSGKTLSVTELLSSRSTSDAIRVRGTLSEPRPAESSGASFLLTDATAKDKSQRCTLELGAVSPKAFDGKAVVVQCASSACNHCFFVK
jgi:hypothetical protein